MATVNPIAMDIEKDVNGAQFGSINVGDVNHFLTAFNGVEGLAADPMQSAEKSAKTKNSENIYDKMIAPLAEFREKFEALVANIGQVVSKGDVSMSELFMVQYQLLQFSYMNDMSAKTADKVSQGIQTLYRNQG
ncbi:MAG: hypothetical protein LBI69_01355 [Puniceicoccales bacterium]|jgi:hypothetical protein|nr:hypothetical protein [Puniceicoccales bacterium]